MSDKANPTQPPNEAPAKRRWFSFTKNTTSVEEPLSDQQSNQQSKEAAGEGQPATRPGGKKSWFARLTQGLSKTRQSLGNGIAALLMGKKTIDDDLLEDLETALLSADVGIEATNHLIGKLTEALDRKQLKDSDALFNTLKDELKAILAPVARPLEIQKRGKPTVILVVGVNGAGKTTTIGKLAHQYKQQGLSVMLAAGDTFRAAAVEQLATWGERNKVPVIAQSTGADSASVIYDALSSATARGVDVLIADTAGRLQNKGHLMEELKKVKRVMAKIDPDSPQEVLLVLDASIGQNAISQMTEFNKAVGVTGVALTKLDGTAKGGILFAIARSFDAAIRCIGVGESVEDLHPFSAEDFVEALFNDHDD